MLARPLQVAPAVAVGDAIQLRVGSDTITVENHVAVIWSVLRYTNGLRAWDDVVDKVASQDDVPRETVLAVAEDLEKLGVLADSRTLQDVVLSFTDNPMPFSTDMRMSDYAAYEHSTGWQAPGVGIALNPVPEASSSRRSCRSYSDSEVSIDSLATLLQQATNRPPSAGGLYPIRLAVVLNRSAGDFAPGLYHYDSTKHALIPGASTSAEERRFLLNREDGVHNAPVVIVVAADMQRQTAKYANRGWRYSLIEAGVAVDRLVETATKVRLGSLVFGGYDDDAISRALFGEDTPRVRSLVSVAVGHPSSTAGPDLDLEDLHAQVDELFVGEGRLVEGAGLTSLWRQPGDLSFHQVLATMRADEDASVGEEENRMCGGTGASTIAARAKAIVECVERHSSGVVRIDRFGSASDVNPSFDLAPYAPLRPDQIRNNAFLTEFEPETPIEWVEALELPSGEQTFVPIDLAFYPLSTKSLGRPLLFAANSSGVASHTDPHEAMRRALLELIERHAVLTSWHAQLAPHLVPQDDLSEYATNRRRYWREQGYDLLVLDYTVLGTPVAGVAIGSDAHFPAFAFGSAAAVDFDTAVVKALQEAEVGIAGYRSLEDEAIAAEVVATPIQHGRFHAYDEHRTAWSFLLSSKTPAAYVTPDALTDFDRLVAEVEPTMVTLDSPEPIHTVRVLSTRLFPISFGAGLEHRPQWSVAPAIPHFIA